ncbi:DedA family protein [Croceicoccus bisphenolivorans]|uniref:DedA family protein n=1 Tax=Croceicoccus bisphenolivorans TaxID=1783232 RepID=UPI00082C6793|nr:DedA family protein [Croceicoccus bisphenolivorans]
MNQWIIQLIEGGGYLGIAFLMALENVFPPIPSEVIMWVGGNAVHHGRMSFWPLLWWGTVGSTFGNYLWFLLGDRMGYERTRPFVEKHGRWLTMDWGHVEATERFFARHGQWVVFFLRFSPFLRTIISLPAGLMHMNHVKFLAFTFGGAAIWNALLIGSATILAGWFSGLENILGYVVIGLLALALLGYLVRVLTWKSTHPAQDAAE